MYNYPLSFACGVLAMGFATASYFQKNKTNYLICQLLNITSLVLSYFFLEEFVALVSFAVSFLRAGMFFAYEKKDKEVSLWLKLFFVGLAIASYVLVNVIILQKAGWLDILCVLANILYTFSFGIRNLRVMRYVVLAPNLLSVVYNSLLPATLFVIISFGFELSANAVSILQNDLLPTYKKHKKSQKEYIHEND